jgi:hypothetical protein
MNGSDYKISGVAMVKFAKNDRAKPRTTILHISKSVEFLLILNNSHEKFLCNC